APAPPASRRRSPVGTLLLLFGAGTVVLLLFAGVAAGVLWWLQPWADRGPGTVYNPVAVKFHVPAKVGDERKVSVSADYKYTKESKSDAGNQTNRKTDKVV